MYHEIIIILLLNFEIAEYQINRHKNNANLFRQTSLNQEDQIRAYVIILNDAIPPRSCLHGSQ